MGIEQLYGGWIKKISYKGVRLRTLPSTINSLSLDFNGIIHKVAQSVYAYGEGKDPIKQKALNNFIRIIFCLIYIYLIHIKCV